MPNPRDDMVIIPRLGKNLQATASTRAREERRLAGAKRKGGSLSRIMKVKAARRAQARMRRSGRVTKRIVRGSSGARSALRGARSAAMISGPAVAIGAVVAAVAAIVVIAGSLVSGEPIEGIGMRFRKMMLGTLDNDARSAIETRKRMEASDALAFAGGIQDGVSKQARTIFEDLKRIRARELRGEENLLIEFAGANTIDIMLQKLRTKIVSAWHGSGGDKSLDNLSWEWKMKYGGFTIDDVKGDLYPDTR